MRPEDNENTTLELSQLLMKSISENDIKTIKKIIKDSEDYNVKNKVLTYQNQQSLSPLILAIICNRKEIVKILIRENREQLYNRLNGHTPLIIAIYMNHYQSEKEKIKFLDLLINSHDDLAQYNNFNRTPLMMAVIFGTKNIVAYILNKMKQHPNYKKILEMRDFSDNSALSLAVIRGNTDVLQLLIENNANIATRNNHKRTPLMIAVMYGRINIVAAILNKIKEYQDYHQFLEMRDMSGNTALSLAAIYGKKEIVQLLIENNADIVGKNNNDQTPCQLAGENKHAEIADLIFECWLQKGTEKRLKSTFNNTQTSLAKGDTSDQDKKLVILNSKTHTDLEKITLRKPKV